MAKAKKLKVGDVVHVINGHPVTTPQDGAALMRDCKGVIQLVVTRAGAKSKAREGEGADGDVRRGDKTARSFLPVSLPSRAEGSKRESKRDKQAAADVSQPEEEGNTTVVVSCSRLILESKKIIGSTSGLDEQLDALYAALKAKELSSAKALTRLVEMVGQTTVEHAGLVISNAQQSTLPDGWVEYCESGQRPEPPTHAILPRTLLVSHITYQPARHRALLVSRTTYQPRPAKPRRAKPVTPLLDTTSRRRRSRVPCCSR